MLITPLQYLLKENVVSSKRIIEETGFHRTTLWRWKKGATQPEKHEAQKLIGIYRESDIKINDDSYLLDFNGCYDKTVEVSDDYL